jgi:transketolase
MSWQHLTVLFIFYYFLAIFTYLILVMSGSPPKRLTRAFDDELAINSIRATAADMVQKASSGHPGAPMGCAVIAHALFGYVMNYDPHNCNWWNRDRFVLSNGHACALLYTMMHISGFPDITLDQLKSFRKIKSLTPGHPERHVTPGVELTTGPLGQGLASAVGIAVSQAHLEANYGSDLFNNFTFVLCGDGCLQEGLTSEACSLAGHWGLGRLIVIYDDNKISIDGATDVSFTEDVSKRFEAYGWEVLSVADGDHDLAGIISALNTAKSNLKKPSLIKVRTTIGFGSTKQGSEKTHGAPLGDVDIKLFKEKCGLDPKEFFWIPEEVRNFYKKRAFDGQALAKQWYSILQKSATHVQNELHKRFEGNLDTDALRLLKFVGDKSTRAISGDCLSVLVKNNPSIMGGSADLTESTVCNKAELGAFGRDKFSNRFFHFGVREHAMAAIANGMHAFGGCFPFISTFANFLSYCWPAVRLAALSHHQVLFIATHDSIDLGEDGPTHQPIEINSLLRSTPNILDFRPCDGNETIAAYLAFATRESGPSVLLLNRSSLPQMPNSSVDLALCGGYILKDFKNNKLPKVILAGSGSEISLVADAAQKLEHEIDCRLVSLPSWFLFRLQSVSYKDSVFPKEMKVLYVEAARVLGWQEFADDCIQMEDFGLSGPAADVKDCFGFTVINIVAKARKLCY